MVHHYKQFIMEANLIQRDVDCAAQRHPTIFRIRADHYCYWVSQAFFSAYVALALKGPRIPQAHHPSTNWVALTKVGTAKVRGNELRNFARVGRIVRFDRNDGVTNRSRKSVSKRLRLAPTQLSHDAYVWPHWGTTVMPD